MNTYVNEDNADLPQQLTSILTPELGALTDSYTLLRRVETSDGVNQLFIARSLEDKKLVMVKCVPRQSARTVRLYDHNYSVEAQVLNSLAEVDGVVNILQYFITRSHFFFVLEYHPSAINLTQLTFCVPESMAKLIGSQLVDTLLEVKRRGFVHCDVSETNTLYDFLGQKVILVDFASVQVADGKRKLARGSDDYLPPEVHAQAGGYSDGDRLNVYAVGVIIHSIVFGNPPFESPEMAATCKLDTTGWHRVSPQLRDLLVKCLEKDPRTRLTLDEVKAHPWLKEDVCEETLREDMLEYKLMESKLFKKSSLL